MALINEIKNLAKIPPSEHPFLTLYLDARWNSEKKRDEVRIFLKNKLKECSAHAAGSSRYLSEDAEKMEHYVKGVLNGEWDRGYEGLAIFACRSASIFHVVRSHLPFAQAFYCSDRPVLAPAVVMAHMGQAALLAMVDGDGGRLVGFNLGGVEKSKDIIFTEPPEVHDNEGMGLDRRDRQREEHLSRNLKKVAGQLVRWADTQKPSQVFLEGSDSVVSSLTEQLPKRVSSLVCARVRRDPKENDAHFFSQVLQAASMVRARADEERLTKLLDEDVGAGLGVTTPDAIAVAVGKAQVRTLFVSEGFNQSGYRCMGCARLAAVSSGDTCDCGHLMENVELGEELIRQTLATDGVVVPMADSDWLIKQGGVAAKLRFA